MFKKILVAVDGSSTSNRGLKTAVSLAKEQGAQLLILHVVDMTAPIMYPESGMFIDQVLAAVTEGGKKVLAAAQRDTAKMGVQARTRMAETTGFSVADMIVREAKKSRADLIVLGTHGRQGLKRVVMGSDAENVLRMSTVPVLMVRAPQPRPRKARAARA